MTLHYDFSADDLQAFMTDYRHVIGAERTQETSLIMALMAALLSFFAFREFGLPLSSAIISAVALGALVLFRWKKSMAHLQGNSISRITSAFPEVPEFGRRQLILEAESLIEVRDGVRIEIAKSQFQTARLNAAHLFLYFGAYNALVIPTRAFPDGEAMTTFIQLLTENWGVELVHIDHCRATT